MRAVLIAIGVIAVIGFGFWLTKYLPKDPVYESQDRVNNACTDAWQKLGYASASDCTSKLGIRYLKEK